MKVLLIAYACEPGKGSEQGTGWNLALRLSEKHEVTVVTRSNNREVIEQALEDGKPNGLSFVYHDLGPFWTWIKKRPFFPVQLYYVLWILSLSKCFKGRAAPGNYDLVHHLTFNSFEIPPLFLKEVASLKVWGPIGGGQLAPGQLSSTLAWRSRWKECLRGWRIFLSSKNPLVTATLSRCDLVLFANGETRELLYNSCGARSSLMVDVGVDPDQFHKAEPGAGSQILFAGKFEYRKGARLAFLAFQEALKENPKLQLTMLGDGPDFEREHRWVKKNGLTKSVDLRGRCSHSEMSKAFASADLLVFPSLRDTSGAIVLEAMASEVPVVCLDHQGACLMVDGCSGFRIPVASERDVVRAMASAFVRLTGDENLRRQMGRNARERVVSEFSWKTKAERILEEYERLNRQV